MPDYTQVLGNIRDLLKSGAESGKSVSTLVSEVREAIRGQGEPTLRTAIITLQNEVTREIRELRTAMTGGPGTPAGGPPGARGGGLGPDEHRALLNTATGISTGNER